MGIKSLDQAEIKGKRVLARFDLNVPLNMTGDKIEIADTFRVDLIIPTIKYLLDQGAQKITIMSHLGRPKGQVNKKMSLEPVAQYLAEKLEQEVYLTETSIDSGIKTLLGLPKPKIILLENLRFHAQEENNDREFAEQLSQFGDLYVNDAFGAVHRGHTSVYEIVHFFPHAAYAGPLLVKELESLKKITQSPVKPFMAVIGGAKVKDKIATIERLLPLIDKLFIGGAMAYPFLKAKGQEVGRSLCQEEDYLLAQKILKHPSAEKILLPIDHIVANSPDDDAKSTSVIGEQEIGFDIGPETVKLFEENLKQAQTLFWNGPMGLFENERFAKGTFSLAEIIATKVEGFTIVGGGDSVSAVKKSGHAQGIDHISSGGGAGLEYIEKGVLPGLTALQFGVD